jgi:Icc-related predicted phosphoesterase
MRIHLLSDLHFEFGKMPSTYTPPECDVVILSGDISPGLPGVVWAKKTFKVPVIYVPGNHEFYIQRTMAAQIMLMREEAEGSNVHIMDNDTIEIDGVRFIAATMWTDYNLYGSQYLSMSACQRRMNDFSQCYVDIEGGGVEHFSAPKALELHQESRLYVTTELAKPFDGKTVVVTHHAPSEKSIHARYGMDALNPGYASRLESIMLDYNPVLWTHGHVHTSFDYQIGDTRVVSNPRGYEGRETNPNFDYQLVIEI